MRGIIVALVPLTATTLEPTTRRRAAQRLAAAAAPRTALRIQRRPADPAAEGRRPRGDRAVEQAPTARGRGAERQGVRFAAPTGAATATSSRLLGKQASARRRVRRVRPRGLGAAPGLCKAAKIGAYPTWAAPDGRLFSGVRSLDDLEVLAGLQGGARQEADDEQAAARAAAVVPALRAWRPPWPRAARSSTGPTCRFCDQQRQLFGKTAWPRVPAYECDPRGTKAQPAKCAPPSGPTRRGSSTGRR